MKGSKSLSSRYTGICTSLMLAMCLAAPNAGAFSVLDLIPGVVAGAQNAITEVKDRIPKYENNREPLICQGTVGGSWLAASLVSKVSPPTPTGQAVKFGADTSAYLANIALKFCKPMIAPPEPLHVFPDSSSPCRGNIHQPVTQSTYENIYGIPKSRLFADLDDAAYNRGLKNHSVKTIWGDLGRPAVYNFNIDADVRLIDPNKEEGAEDDAWMPDADGNITLPVGRNVVTWRADTVMPLVDLVPVYAIPFVAPGDKIAQKIVMKNRRLSEFVYKSYGRLTRYGDGGKVRKVVTKFIAKKIQGALEDAPKTVVEKILGGPLSHEWRTSYLTGLRFAGGKDVGANSVGQEVWVYDFSPPTLETNKDPASFPSTLQPLLSYDPTVDTYYLEAFAPRIADATVAAYGKMLLSAHDDCQGSRPALNPERLDTPQRNFWISGDQGTLQWQVADDGPNLDGNSNLSPVVDQKFEVRDTNPPALIAPPSKVVETSGTSANVQLGSPRVFDLADLTPTVNNDVNNDPSATPSFNLGINTVTWTATDFGGNSTTKQQLINVKVAGTNTAPIGYNQSVSAVSYKPTDIILKGFDADTDPNTGRHDPLSFTIKDKPANGFFVAPLLPYFIDDYRLEASALRFAGQTEQVDPIQYCKDLQDGTVTGPDVFQMKYPYTSEWFNVDDDGTTVVYDQGDMRCNTGDLGSSYRLASFDANGDLLHHITVNSTLTNVYIDWLTKGVYALDNTDPGEPDDVNYYDKDLNPLGTFKAEYSDSFGTHRITGTASIAADHQGIVYVAGPGETGDVVAAYQGPTAAGALGTNSYNRLGVFYSDGDTNMRDIATDSQNNVYISKPDRILKFAPSSIDDQGKLVPGAFIGWMGRCDSNLTNTYTCDTVNHRSLGFSCTDTLCGTTGNNYGSEPAQFNDARGIAVDPHDILYVSDYGNSRVQRFTPEGDFAGQAVSNGAGYGFILGDFGKPKDITVNSDHFYILNNNLLHVLQTTPVTPIDDTTAKVTYQSDDNFVGTDTFTFEATDGLASGTGTVSVNVERNYRPPVISVPPGYTLSEDGTVDITLVGSDPDGSLDTLSYAIVDQPQHGTLSGTGANIVYTPDANYNGDDSFSYRVSDGVYQSKPAVVVLTITSVEDAPQVTTEASTNEGLGFKFQFPVDVFDPDKDENLKVTVDWGDGTIDHDGVIMQNGAVVTESYTPPDGATTDDLESTGPVLDLDEDGNGTVGFEHAYTAVGDHVAQICVSDRVLTLSDGTKQTTADSQTSCTQTTFSISLLNDLILLVEPESSEVDPGTTQKFTITVDNRPFDVDVPGTPKGLDAANVVVSGESGAGIAIGGISSDQGSCTIDQATFSCNLGLINFGETATMEVDGNIGDLAPGNAILTMTANRQADSVALLEDEAIGAVKVNASGKPPLAVSLSDSVGSTSGGQTLTITGQDFDADADVLFDSVPATEVEVVDATTITLTTPAHTEEGLIDVVVVNSDDQLTMLPSAFHFLTVVPVSGGNPDATSGDGGNSGGTTTGGTNDSGGGSGSLDTTSIILLSLFLSLPWLRRRPAPTKRALCAAGEPLI